jgi:hypothetical protein
VFVLCGDFNRLAPAIYNSAMLYMTLDWGDAVMFASWKILGPFEADALLIFQPINGNSDCRYTVDASDEIPRSS